MADVEITLDGKTETLRPSLKAAKAICTAGGPGGFQHVENRLLLLDIEFYILVVAAGLGKKSADVEEAVFRTGLPPLMRDLVKFCVLCANGGKPMRAKKLKTTEIEGKTYAEVENGEPVYVDLEPQAAVNTAGEA